MNAVFLVCLLASYPALVACQDTVYVACILNLDKDGPTVIDVPGGAGPGTVNLLADSKKLKIAQISESMAPARVHGIYGTYHEPACLGFEQ